MGGVLRPETQELVDEVEKRTGLPVQIVPIQGLAVAATITLSPHATDSYLLQYRPGISYKDYAVAIQCSHLLRVLAVPEAGRRQFALHESAVAWGGKLVRAHLKATKKPALPDHVVASFVSQLVGGLLTQLRSIPIGMRHPEREGLLWRSGPEARSGRGLRSRSEPGPTSSADAASVPRTARCRWRLIQRPATLEPRA